MCPLMWAHWCQLVNMIEIELCFLQPIRVHNPNCKSIGSAISAQLMAKSLYFTMGNPFSQNCPFSFGDFNPDLIRDNLGHSERTIQMASWSVQPFLHRWPQSVPLLYNGCPFPQNCPFPWGGSGPHLTHDTFGQSEPITQIASCAQLSAECLYAVQWNAPFPSKKAPIVSAIFAGLAGVTDRPTDHATRSVTIDCFYVRSMGDAV